MPTTQKVVPMSKEHIWTCLWGVGRKRGWSNHDRLVSPTSV